MGTRGIPNVPGGVEKHCEELYPRLARLHEITVFCRRPYFTTRIKEYKKIRLKYVWCPRTKSFEAILHTILCLIIARMYSPDLIHIHSIGPALVTPLARLMGLKVIFTYHSRDYERIKWGKTARIFLKLGEYLGVKYANSTIVVSKNLQKLVRNKFMNTKLTLIPNGTVKPSKISTDSTLKRFGLQPQRYILSVSRFVPEKGLHDLIEAFMKTDQKRVKLVLVGDTDHQSDYSERLKKSALLNNVVLTGYQNGHGLAELFANAGLYVLPSYFEGSPISLLEALSYGLPVILSDIEANREFNLEDNRYFFPGDITNLSSKILLNLGKEFSLKEKADIDSKLQNVYNWDRIAEATNLAYNNL